MAVRLLPKQDWRDNQDAALFRHSLLPVVCATAAFLLATTWLSWALPWVCCGRSCNLGRFDFFALNHFVPDGRSPVKHVCSDSAIGTFISLS